MNTFNRLSHEAQTEIKSMIVDAINDGRLTDKPTSEFHHEIFNTDYFIIGRYQAEQWLTKHFGIFQAIDVIKEYEQDNFGEVITDLSEAENVCNMFVYIAGEELINSLSVISDNWDEELDEEQFSELLSELED